MQGCSPCESPAFEDLHADLDDADADARRNEHHKNTAENSHAAQAGQTCRRNEQQGHHAGSDAPDGLQPSGSFVVDGQSLGGQGGQYSGHGVCQGGERSHCADDEQGDQYPAQGEGLEYGYYG